MAGFVAFADVANRDDETDTPLWWNNTDGWGSESTATIFNDVEAATMNAPIGVKVVKVPVTVRFPIDL